MPKYLMEWKYTAPGFTGVKGEGGTARREITRKSIESVGGQLESYYFAFGEWDGFLIADLPDDESAAALSTTAASSGTVSTRIVVLLTPEQIDDSVKRSVDYRPPGT